MAKAANFLKKHYLIILLFLIGIYASRYLIFPGFVPTHDGEYHIIRLWQFDKTVRDFNFFPVWAPDLNNGYGIPLFGFFYPLPNYIGEIFHLLSFSYVDSIKYILASSLILSGGFFYLWMKCFFKEKFAFLGSILYILAPYHLLDIHVRGSVGEAWSLTLLPLVFFLLAKLVEKKSQDKKYFFFAALSLSLLLLSHNILGVLFFVFTFFYGSILHFHFKRKIKLSYYFVFVLGFLMSAFFWLPIFFESRYVIGLAAINYKDHFPAFFQLMFPSWGTGFSVSGVSDQMSFQIGVIHLFSILLAIFVLFKNRRKDVQLIFFITCFLITIFLLLENSAFIWQILPFMKYFQYPWRLLSLIIVVSSFLVGYVSHLKCQNFLFWLIFVFSFIFYLPYTKPVVYQSRNDNFYLLNKNWSSGNATLGNSFLPIWFKKNQDAFMEKVQIISGKGEIYDLKIKTEKANFSADLKEKAKIRYNNAYFPGWTVKIDGSYEEIDYSRGVIDFTVPSGKHSIIILFEGSFTRKVAKVISLISLLILFFITFKRKKYHEHRL